MAKDITITWDLPTTRRDGGALPVDQIQETVVQMSADGGANFGELARVAPTDEQRVFVPDAEVGEWQFIIRVWDTDGQEGESHLEVVTVVDDSPPGPVTNVGVTLD